MSLFGDVVAREVVFEKSLFDTHREREVVCERKRGRGEACSLHIKSRRPIIVLSELYSTKLDQLEEDMNKSETELRRLDDAVKQSAINLSADKNVSDHNVSRPS